MLSVKLRRVCNFKFLSLQVVTAVQKAVLDGKRSLVKVPLNKDNSFPHRIDGYFGASKVRDGALQT